MKGYLGHVACGRAARFRIPVDSFNPGTFWIVSLNRESRSPTVRELQLIASYCEYLVRRVYNETYVQRILAKPFPAMGGHNTTIFKKQGPNAWVYRQMMWDGPFFEPHATPLPLAALLERIETNNGKTVWPPWNEWKAAHPALFPPTNKS